MLVGADLYADSDRNIMERVGEVAQARGVPMAQVALAWVLSNPAVTAPVVGATRLSHLDGALAAVDIELGVDELDRLEAPYEPHASAGFDVPRVRGRRAGD